MSVARTVDGSVPLPSSRFKRVASLVLAPYLVAGAQMSFSLDRRRGRLVVFFTIGLSANILGVRSAGP